MSDDGKRTIQRPALFKFANTDILSWRRCLSYRNQSIDLLCKNCQKLSFNDANYEDTGLRIFEWIACHNGKHKNFHAVKRAVNQGYSHVALDRMKVVYFGYHNNKFKNKIKEALIDHHLTLKHNCNTRTLHSNICTY